MRTFPAIVYSNKELPLLDEYYVESGIYFLSQSRPAIFQDHEFMGFQGSGAYGANFVNSVHSLVAAWRSDSGNVTMRSSYATRFRGAAIAYVKHLPSNSIYILPDILGEALLYKYEMNGIQIYSGDLLEITKICKKLDLPLTRSLDYSLELVISSNGGFSRSSFKEVTSLNMFEYVVVNSSGSSIHQYAESSGFFEKNQDYDSLLEEAAKEIQDNIRAAATSEPERKVAHLTGGFDSRLVLAAAKSIGATDAFAFYCEGDPVLEETKIAESAAARVGATMTRDPGTRSDFSPKDHGGRVLAPMLLSSGMLTIGPHVGNSITNLTLLSGGYGETFRSFYGHRIGSIPSGQRLTGSHFGKTIWSSYLFSGDADGLFSAEFVESLSIKIDQELERGRSMGVDESDLADYLYLQIRNRYFVGIITTNWNRYFSRFDPLYSPAAVRLAFSIGLEKRSDNIIGYDLMNKFAPELLSIPFDEKKFGDGIFRERNYVQPSEYNFVRPKYDSEEAPIPKFIETAILSIPGATPEDIDYARRIKARASQVSGRAQVRSSVNAVLRKYSEADLAQYFNSDELATLRGRPANTRIRIRVLFALDAALSWLSDDVSVDRVSLTPR